MARRRRIEHFVTDDGVRFSFANVGGGHVRLLVTAPGAAITVLITLGASNLTDLGLLADTALERLHGPADASS